METKSYKRLPKILKINRIDKKQLRISVLFSSGEDRILDFNKIFKVIWKVKKSDPEYKLMNPVEFGKVKIANNTLSWDNAGLFITGLDGKKIKAPYEVGADTLYDLSEMDEALNISIGSLLRKARLSARLSQEQVAARSGTSRTYITKLENDRSDVEMMTLKKIVEAGLNKHLAISIK